MTTWGGLKNNAILSRCKSTLLLIFYDIGADGGGIGGTITFVGIGGVGVACVVHLYLSPLPTCCCPASGPSSIGRDGSIDNLRVFSSAG